MFFVLEQTEKDLVVSLVESLRAWGCVLFPCWAPRNWALAIDATNDNAVEKIKAIKDIFLPGKWFVFVQDEIMHEKYICRIPEAIKTYFRNQENNQNAVLYSKIGSISKKLVNNDWEVLTYLIPSIDTVGIQLSRHVLRLFGKPIYACPAIIDDEIETYPTSKESIDHQILQKSDQVTHLQFESWGMWAVTTILRYNADGTIKVVKKVY